MPVKISDSYESYEILGDFPVLLVPNYDHEPFSTSSQSYKFDNSSVIDSQDPLFCHEIMQKPNIMRMDKEEGTSPL